MFESYQLNSIHGKHCFYRIRSHMGQRSQLVPQSELVVTLATSRSDDEYIDITANLCLGAMILYIAVKIAFWILSPTASTTLHISLILLSMRIFSIVWTSTTKSLAATELLLSLRVTAWSTRSLLTTDFCVSLTSASLITTFWSKSSNWPQSLVFWCFFFGSKLFPF